MQKNYTADFNNIQRKGGTDELQKKPLDFSGNPFTLCYG